MSAPRTASRASTSGVGGHRHRRRIGHRPGDGPVPRGPRRRRGGAGHRRASGRADQRGDRGRRSTDDRAAGRCLVRERDARGLRGHRASALGDADIAVACAGILGDFQAIDVTSVEHFDRVMAVNVRGSVPDHPGGGAADAPAGSRRLHRAVQPRRPPGGDRHGVLLHVQGGTPQPRPGRRRSTWHGRASPSTPCAPASRSRRCSRGAWRPSRTATRCWPRTLRSIHWAGS